MKNIKRFFSLSLLLVLTITLVTGCEPKREGLKFDGDEGKITFQVKQNAKYKISADSKDFRTSREQAVLLGNDFKIGIEFDDDFGYFFKGDFNKVKEARKDSTDYKEVTYSDIKGIQYFYGSYMRYNIILPVKDSEKYYLVLTVYGKEDNEKSAKEAINNEEVIDILNHITEISAKK